MNHDFVLWLLNDILSLKTAGNVSTVRNKLKSIEKTLFFVGILKATAKKRKIRIRNPVDGSEDPDPYQNVTDPEHCLIEIL